MNLRTYLGISLLMATAGLGIGTPALADHDYHSGHRHDRDYHCPVHGRQHYGHHRHNHEYTPFWCKVRHHYYRDHDDRYEPQSHWRQRDGGYRDRDDGHGDRHDGHASRRSGIGYTGRL